jgi:hypothetical protein
LPKIKQPPNRRENTPNLVTLFAIETQCAFDPSIEIVFIQTASKKFLPINQPTPHRQHTVARHKTNAVLLQRVLSELADGHTYF